MEAKDLLAALLMLIYQHLTNLYNESAFAWKNVILNIFEYFGVHGKHWSKTSTPAMQAAK